MEFSTILMHIGGLVISISFVVAFTVTLKWMLKHRSAFLKEYRQFCVEHQLDHSQRRFVEFGDSGGSNEILNSSAGNKMSNTQVSRMS